MVADLVEVGGFGRGGGFGRDGFGRDGFGRGFGGFGGPFLEGLPVVY